MYHRLGHIEALFKVADEPTPADQPAECSFNDPATGQHLEAWVPIEMTHNCDNKIQERRLVEQPGAVIGAIGEQMLDPRPTLADRSQDRLGAGAVGNVRRG